MEISQYKERIKKDIILPLKEQMKELGISCGYDLFAVWECEVILTKYILWRKDKQKANHKSGSLFCCAIAPTVLGTDEQLAIASCSRRHLSVDVIVYISIYFT